MSPICLLKRVGFDELGEEGGQTGSLVKGNVSGGGVWVFSVFPSLTHFPLISALLCVQDTAVLPEPWEHFTPLAALDTGLVTVPHCCCSLSVGPCHPPYTLLAPFIKYLQ